METEEILANARRLRSEFDRKNGMALLGITTELVRHYTGENNSSYRHLQEIDTTWPDPRIKAQVINILDGFISIVENGLMDGVSIERQAQIDVVSAILEQAQRLLNTNGVHPAAPCIVIGAALEEFLRNWVKEKNLTIESTKPSIDAYAKALLKASLIKTQDMKDITSWAGRRNDAAHGKWEDVNDRKLIALILEHVNLFMRKYGPNL